MIISHNKEKKPKVVPLLDEAIALIREIREKSRGLPHMYFFRHEKGKGAKPGQRFGKDYLYSWWKRACANLDIEDVDLYGGTRHSSAVSLREYYTPEQIKRATMHATNSAFERYFRLEYEDIKKIYSTLSHHPTTSSGDTKVIRIFEHSEKVK